MFNLMTTLLNSTSKSLLLISMIALASCSNNVEDLESSSHSTISTSAFIANEASGSASAVSNQASLWSGLESSKRIDFQVCLKDRAFINRPLINKVLTVINDKNEKATRSTDTSGCLTWHEVVSYNFSDDETYYNYPVTIKGGANYPGELNIKLAVNPWKNGSEAVKDLGFRSEIKTSNKHSLGLIEKLVNNESNLVVKSLRINNKSSSLAAKEKGSFQIVLNPLLRRNSLSGKVVSPIEGQGKFSLSLQVYREIDGDEGQLYKVFSTSQEVALKDKEIKAVFDSQKPLHRLDSNSTYYYNLELSALGTNQINDYKAYFKSRDLFGKGLSEAYEYNSSLTQVLDAEIIESLIASNASDSEFKIEEVKQFTLSSEVDGNYNLNSQREVRVKFVACFTDPYSAKGLSPLADIRFDVKVKDNQNKLDSKDIRLSTSNNNGCINSYTVISYDEFSKDRSWRNYNIEFTALAGHYKGSTVSRTIAINPWNPNDLGYDLERETPPSAQDAQAPRIKVDTVKINYNGNDSDKFKMNKYLHLTLHKKINLTMSPKVELFQAYNKEKLPSALTYGRYTVTASIFTPKKREVNYKSPNLENFTLISTARKHGVKVDSSAIIDEELSFPMKVSETQFLSMKNLLVLEIKPDDRKTQLREGVFTMPLELLSGTKTEVANIFEYYNQFITFKDELNKLAKLGTKLPITSVDGKPFLQSPHEIYTEKLKAMAQQSNTHIRFLQRSEFNKLLNTDSKISESDMAMLATAGVMPNKVLKKFCSHLYVQKTGLFAKNKAYNNCLKAPKKAMTYSPSVHVVELYKAKKQRNEYGEIVGTYAKAKYIKSTTSKITRVKTHAVREGSRWYRGGGERKATGFSTGFSPFFMGVAATAMKSYELYQVEDEGELQVAFGGTSVSNNLPDLDVNALKVRAKATVKECITVANISNDRAIHLCSDKQRKRYIEEEWFFIGEDQTIKNSALSDGNKVGNGNFKQVIRGRASFEKLWKNLKRESVLIVVQELDKMALSKTFRDYQIEGINGIPFESFVDSSFPGMIVPAKTK